MKTYNFGIVGAGSISNFHAKAIGDLENARLIAVCDMVTEAADKFAANNNCKAFDNIEKMLALDELDVVTIATPSGAHMEPAIAAANAGKHAICEKPIEVTLNRIDEIIKVHKKADTQLGCVFQSRFDRSAKLVKNALETGRFGNIVYAGAYVPWWRTDEYYNGTWRGTRALDGGGALMNQSIHMIDLLNWLVGPAVAIRAYTDRIAHTQIEVEDTASASIRWSNGALGSIFGTTGAWPGSPRRIEIYGDKGSVVVVDGKITQWQFQDEKPEDEQIRNDDRNDHQKGGSSDPTAIEHVGHTKNFAAFLDALDKDEHFELDGTEGRKAVELILNLYKSAETGREIVFE